MRGKILIICDEEERYKEYRTMLGSEFELVEAAHEREAVELLTREEEVADAILMDLRMNNKKSEALIQLITLDITTKYWW